MFIFNGLAASVKLSRTFVRNYIIGKLDNRTCYSVRGSLAADFLQGLLTNDVRSIARAGSFMYSLFLNTKGRVISDAFLYKLDANDDMYLLEVDLQAGEELVSYLSKYNIRRKISIEHIQSISVHVAIPNASDALDGNLTDNKSWFPIRQHADLMFYAPDPRATKGWCGRILLRNPVDGKKYIGARPRISVLPMPLSAVVERIFPAANLESFSYDAYRVARWQMGLPEGSEELISGETLPFEANADLSGAVNFSKGCYVGQELTARTRFTGVVRRRLLPVQLKATDVTSPVQPLEHSDYFTAPVYNIPLSSEPNLREVVRTKIKPVGWLRVCLPTLPPTAKANGLALLRLTEAAAAVSEQNGASNLIAFTRGDQERTVQVTPFVPSWWPDTIAPSLARC